MVLYIQKCILFWRNIFPFFGFPSDYLQQGFFKTQNVKNVSLYKVVYSVKKIYVSTPQKRTGKIASHFSSSLYLSFPAVSFRKCTSLPDSYLPSDLLQKCSQWRFLMLEQFVFFVGK